MQKLRNELFQSLRTLLQHSSAVQECDARDCAIKYKSRAPKKRIRYTMMPMNNLLPHQTIIKKLFLKNMQHFKKSGVLNYKGLKSSTSWI
jgi:hypothetical protein